MEYSRGTLIGGALTRSLGRNWDWSRDGGCYALGRDFFTVHWEVQARDPRHVRLHVEAPTRSADALLNGIKHALLGHILASGIARFAENGGYRWGEGKRTSDASIARYKSTEAFRVSRSQGDSLVPAPEALIALVDSDLGDYVGNLIDRIRPTLHSHFPPGTAISNSGTTP